MQRQQELQRILRLQEQRCIYCNVRFTRRTSATRDHIVCGGENWSLNIVMACRSCNSRRCDIPFRTYCKLLSPTQNRRIVLHLCRRLLALEVDALPEGRLAYFEMGLAAHEPKHWRYRHIRRWSAVARRN